MPSPRNGSAGSAVVPAAPKKALEADDANPGNVEKIKAEQRQTQTGKYGSIRTKPHMSPEGEDEKKTKISWIEIQMLNEAGKPVTGQSYKVTLADETVAEGTLDAKGFARIDGIEPGSCKVTFPGLDKEAWKKT